jgi:hypothetical protein
MKAKRRAGPVGSNELLGSASIQNGRPVQGPTPSILSTRIRVTHPGGGPPIGGNFTPGPIYTCANLLQELGRASFLDACLAVEHCILRKLHRTFRVSFDADRDSGIEQDVLDLPILSGVAGDDIVSSSPIQTRVACGLPSGSSVTRGAGRSDKMSLRIRGWIFISGPPWMEALTYCFLHKRPH